MQEIVCFHRVLAFFFWKRKRMYKMKLQELSHQRKWALPNYSAVRDGPDHFPRFKATVSVNGISFHSTVYCKSSKEAKNDAAKLAFLHFSDASLSSGKPNFQEPNVEGTAQEPHINQSHVQGFRDDVHFQYKSQLHNYARWRNCGLPQYSSSFEGPPHSRCFKATVAVGGRTFASLDFFRTLKEAEECAAKVALNSLPTDGFEESNCGFYKNLLQELAQREGFSTPVYKTMKSGALHEPIFISSVEVEEEIFSGKAGKSKKEAEMKAAKVAYTVLTERALNRASKLAADESPNSTLGSDFIPFIDSPQNIESNSKPFSSPNIKQTELSAECKGDIFLNTVDVGEVNLDEIISAIAEVAVDNSVLSPEEESVKKKVIETEESSFCAPILFEESVMDVPSILTHPESSSLSISKPNVKKDNGRSCLLCNRFRVYSRYPDIPLPKGIMLLPVSDDKWMAVRLEFPDEEGCLSSEVASYPL